MGQHYIENGAKMTKRLLCLAKKNLIITLMIFLFVQCRSTNVITFKNTKKYMGKTNNETQSREKIDKENTYEKYFIIKNNEKCIKIIITSTIIDDVFKREKKVKTYYIVEKAVNVSRFRDAGGKRYIFSELGRNFDANWNIKKDALICSSDTDPIKKLDKNIYRIRFTTFSKEDSNFKIELSSDNAIDFLDKPF